MNIDTVRAQCHSGRSGRRARANTVFVGISGTGTLTIQESGGNLSDFNGYVGFNAGSTGTATIDGAGSAWTASNLFAVGYYGTGTLTILNSGTVSNTNIGLIGSNVGSNR